MHVPEAKVVILGAQGVGKTSFIHRYVGQIFEQHTSPTIGASFFTCNIKVDEHELKLLIWDTAGQERFRCMKFQGHSDLICINDQFHQISFKHLNCNRNSTDGYINAPMYYRKANAAILMFDITCYESFESMKAWIVELKVRLEEPIITCVVGNKCDMNNFRQVGYKEAADYAFSIGALYHEASALSSEGVEGVFLDIAQQIIRQNETNMREGFHNFNDGRIIRVSSIQNRQKVEDDEEKSLLCC